MPASPQPNKSLLLRDPEMIARESNGSNFPDAGGSAVALAIFLENEFFKAHTGAWMVFLWCGIISLGLQSPIALKPVLKKVHLGPQ